MKKLNAIETRIEAQKDFYQQERIKENVQSILLCYSDGLLSYEECQEKLIVLEMESYQLRRKNYNRAIDTYRDLEKYAFSVYEKSFKANKTEIYQEAISLFQRALDIKNKAETYFDSFKQAMQNVESTYAVYSNNQDISKKIELRNDYKKAVQALQEIYGSSLYDVYSGSIDSLMKNLKEVEEKLAKSKDSQPGEE